MLALVPNVLLILVIELSWLELAVSMFVTRVAKDPVLLLTAVST